MENEKKKFEFIDARDKVFEIMKTRERFLCHRWIKSDVVFCLLNLIDHHGRDSVSALCRYIDYAQERGQGVNEIAATIGHDLNGAGENCFSPRTIEY